MAQRDCYYIKRPLSHLLQGVFITQSRLLSRESIITQQPTLILKIITETPSGHGEINIQS